MRAGIIRPCVAGVRYCASGLLTAAVWTLWLLLAVLLALQVYVASVREMQVPRFLLRAIEDHLAASGISVKFGRAILDPSGRVLIEKARFRLESFAEPVVTADAIYIRLDPWALFERRFEPREIRATGANLFIPAMLSTSGRAEKMVQDLDAGFSITSRGDEFSVDYLNCRFGGVSVSAHGAINAGTVARRGRPATALPLAEFVSTNYVTLSREFSKAEERMAGLGHAAVTAVLTPSDTRGAVVYAELGASSLSLDDPVAVEARGIRAETRFPLLGGAPLMTSALASADTISVAGRVSATAVRIRARGILKVDTFSFSPRQIDATAGSVTAEGAEVLAPMARVVPSDDLRSAAVEATAWVQGCPLRAAANVNLPAKSADITFEGLVSPGVIEPISAHLRNDIRRFVDLAEPVAVAGRVRLAKGWRLADLAAHVDGRNFTAYHVHFDEARGDVTFDGTRFAARRALARSGENYAAGSYEQDFATKGYRYLLSGRLRPLDISPWFLGHWWQDLFKNFGFPAAPPDATVDVQGRYVHYRYFSVFGYVDAKDPVLLGTPVDGLRTRLFVDQSGCEGLESEVSMGQGSVQGSFRLATDPATGRWAGLDIEARSTVDPTLFGGLLPPAGGAAVASFSFGRPPSVYARGHFDGPAAPDPRHKSLHTEVRAGGALSVHGVAFEKASFKVDVNDDEVSVSDVEAGFAGGIATGSARLAGANGERRLRFRASLNDASLGQAAEAAAGYVIKKASGSSPALETFARDKSGVRLDLNVSGEGAPGVLASFTGEGNCQIQGSKLGEFALLGGLSRFLKFPELRFTQVMAEFKLENAALSFPDVSVIGANSAIKAKGAYQIDRRQLDFTATVYPFQESRSFLQLFNAISAPLSAVFRVRLTGSVDKPSWNLAYSPLNLLREGDMKPDKVAPQPPLAAPPATP